MYFLYIPKQSHVRMQIRLIEIESIFYGALLHSVWGIDLFLRMSVLLLRHFIVDALLFLITTIKIINDFCLLSLVFKTILTKFSLIFRNPNCIFYFYSPTKMRWNKFDIYLDLCLCEWTEFDVVFFVWMIDMGVQFINLSVHPFIDYSEL